MPLNGITPHPQASAPAPHAASYAAQLAERAVAARLERRGLSSPSRHAAAEGANGAKERGVAFRVPAGESGNANLRAPTSASAMVRLIAFEHGHLASHARKAVARGQVVQRQWINVKVGMAPGGEVVPVGGSAETVVEDAGPAGWNAAGEVARELAYAGELGRIFAVPGSAYMPFARRIFPRVVANDDTVLSALQIERDIRELGARLAQSFFEVHRSNAPGVLRAKLDELAVVEEALSGLRDALEPLRSPQSFTAAGGGGGRGDGALELVRNLVESYNAAVSALNRSLRPGSGLLLDEGVVARAREAVVGGLNAPVAGLAEPTDEAADAGLLRVRRGKVTFGEEALSSVLRQLRDFFAPAPTVAAEGVPSVGASLGRLGIVADENDTLALDEGTFRRAMIERPGEVADLFSRVGERDDAADSGLAVRTGDYLERALRPDSGSFAIRRAVINALIERRPGVDYVGALRDVLQQSTLSLLI